MVYSVWHLNFSSCKNLFKLHIEFHPSALLTKRTCLGTRASGMSVISRLVLLAADRGVSGCTAAITFFFLVAIFWFVLRRSTLNTSEFPYLGQEYGNVAQKRQFFMANALKIFRDGYSKVIPSIHSNLG